MSSSYQEKGEYAQKATGYSLTGSGGSGTFSAGSEIDVAFVVRAITSRLRLFSLLLFSVFLASVFLTIKKTPYYSANCKIVLSPEKKAVSGFDDLYEASELGFHERKTELMRITSRKNLESVARESSLNKTYVNLSVEERTSKILSYLSGSFSASDLFDTYIVNIKCDSPDPKLAMEHANLLAKVYLSDYKQRISGISHKGLEKLKIKANKMLEDFNKKSQTLHSFEATNNLISIDKDYQSLAVLRLSSLMDFKIETEHERLGLGVDLKNLETAKKEGHLDFEEGILKSPKIIALKREIRTEEAKMIRLRKNKGKQNLDVLNQIKLIDNLKNKIKDEMDLHIAKVKSDFNKHDQREKLLVESLTKSKDEYNANVVEYQHLKNQVAIVDVSLKKILTRIEEIEIANTLEIDSESLGIYSYATLPGAPSRPNKLKEFSLGLMVAIAVAAGLCLLLEILDATLKSKTDIEKLLGIPVISYIPRFPDIADELPVTNNPNSTVAESFRALRTTLLLNKSAQQGRIFMLTSTSASEGKTTFAANIALSMQQQGKKVLLIECDFRKSRLEEVFESEVKKGFSNYLMSEDEYDFSEYLTKSSNGLDIFFAGPTPFNPTELLQSDKFDEFLKIALERYEYVFISSTPASTLSDSRIIAAKEEIVTLFLVRAFSTHSRLAQAAVKDLENIGAKFAGVIVNGVDVPIKGRDSYSEYTSYYGKYSDKSDDFEVL